MQYLLLFSSVIVIIAALPYKVVEDEDGQQYYMVSLERSKRQTTNWNIQSPGIGTLSHSGNLLDNNNHRLDGTGYVSKDFRVGGIKPDAYGGQLDYMHKPSGSGLGLGADHVRRGGTDLKASGTWNFIHNKNADVGLRGEYGRHFGGPGGSGKPQYGAFLEGKIKF